MWRNLKVDVVRMAYTAFASDGHMTVVMVSPIAGHPDRGNAWPRSGPRSGTTGSRAECHHIYMNLTGQVAERYVRDAMALDPVSATLAGISGFDDQMADLTPDGLEARAGWRCCRPPPSY